MLFALLALLAIGCGGSAAAGKAGMSPGAPPTETAVSNDADGIVDEQDQAPAGRLYGRRWRKHRRAAGTCRPGACPRRHRRVPGEDKATTDVAELKTSKRARRGYRHRQKLAGRS
jgi:hypothetical protein